MKLGVLILGLALSVGMLFYGRTLRRHQASAASHPNTGVTYGQDKVNLALNDKETATKVEFKAVRSILEGRCKPCHFPGGTMYERLPFDRPETIIKLDRKLFTRIKDENDRRLITEFLSEQSQAR